MAVCALLPPLNLFFRGLPGPAAPIILALPNIAGQFIPPSAPISPAHVSWMVIGSLILAGLWAMVVFVSLLRLAASLWRLRRIKAAAEPVSASALNCVGVDSGHDDATAKQLARITIALSREVRSPGLAGFFRPAILLPADITSWTTAEERSAMLRHEAAHIERHDHLAGLFVSTIRAFLFFHPMVHLACNRISLERELACDDRVLGLGAKPQAYAESILKAVERSILVDAVHQAPSFASKKTLERRIEMILNGNHRARPLRQWRFLLLPAALIIAVTWLVMPPGNGLAQAAADGSGRGTASNSFYAALTLPFIKSFNHLRNHTYRMPNPRSQKDVPVVDKDT
ncbi:MAG: M56 family metallopeptidase, partial [Blastocatellia bacterium]